MIKNRDLKQLSGRGMLSVIFAAVAVVTVMNPTRVEACPNPVWGGCSSACDMVEEYSECSDYACGAWSSCVIQTCQEKLFYTYQTDENGNCVVLCGSVADYNCNCLTFICP